VNTIILIVLIIVLFLFSSNLLLIPERRNVETNEMLANQIKILEQVNKKFDENGVLTERISLEELKVINKMTSRTLIYTDITSNLIKALLKSKKVTDYKINSKPEPWFKKLEVPTGFTGEGELIFIDTTRTEGN